MKRHALQILLCSAAFALAGAAAEAQPRGGHGGHDRPNPRAQISMALRAADANGDNSITRAEVEQLQAEMFEWMDRNSDGFLDIDDQSPINRRLMETRERELGDEEPRERRGMMRRRGGPGGRMGPMGGSPREIDLDGDERISRAEFLGMENRIFDRIDADSDGTITPEELDAMVEQAQDRRERRRFWWRD